MIPGGRPAISYQLTHLREPLCCYVPTSACRLMPSRMPLCGMAGAVLLLGH